MDKQTGRVITGEAFSGSAPVRCGAHVFGIPEVIHGGAGTGPEAASPFILLSFDGAGKGFQQITGNGIRKLFVISHFGSFIPQQMKETIITIKIFFHGIKQLFSVYFACIEYIFFDGLKGISGCGKTSPVKTIVVVNTA